EDLAAPPSRRRGEKVRGVETFLGDVFEERAQLVGGPGLHLAPGGTDLRWIGEVGDVALHDVPPDGVGEGLAEDAVQVATSLRCEPALAADPATLEHLGVEAVETRGRDRLDSLAPERGYDVEMGAGAGERSGFGMRSVGVVGCWGWRRGGRRCD